MGVEVVEVGDEVVRGKVGVGVWEVWVGVEVEGGRVRVEVWEAGGREGDVRVEGEVVGGGVEGDGKGRG